MTLLEECIEVLGNNICILEDDKKQVIEAEFYHESDVTIGMLSDLI